jgi:phage N-6-adenine-methyltransferase
VTLIGKKARNHPQQVRRDGVDDAIDDRRTPLKIFGPLNEQYNFTIDAAASFANAKCERYWSRAENGLRQSWTGERVWCNPPYSSIEPWVVKTWNEMRLGCELVCMLLPANRTEQGWWQTYVEPWRERTRDGIRLTTVFLPGRIRFGRPGWTPPPKGDRPPFGLVVLTWAGAR